MELILYGTNHTLLEVAQRETIAFAEDEIEDTVQELTQEKNVREACILSTCNRVEFLLVGDDSFCAPRLVRELIQRRKGVDIRQWTGGFYSYRNEEAVEHLFRVVTSLDSMVIGEVDIVHQTKQMYQLAADAGATDLVLDRLFHQAFKVGKQARTDTDISTGTMSVSMAAVEHLQAAYGELSSRSALVVGGGKMALQMARYLKKRGIGELRMSNRTLEKIRHHADRLDAPTVPLSSFQEAARDMDFVMISIDHEGGHFLTRSDLETLDEARQGRPVVITDISVPRVVEHVPEGFENVTVYDIEDFEEILEANHRKREAAIREVEQLIERAVHRFTHWQREAAVLPDIIRLRKRVKAICEEELAKREDRLPDEASDTVRELANALSERIIDVPIRTLKNAVMDTGVEQQLTSFRELFDLNADGDGGGAETGRNGPETGQDGAGSDGGRDAANHGGDTDQEANGPDAPATREPRDPT